MLRRSSGIGCLYYGASGLALRPAGPAVIVHGFTGFLPARAGLRSALSGSGTDFIMVVTTAYTGMRWSEALGLLPGCLQGDQLRIDWKLYELESRFYRGRPKDGSIRSVDMPPFLAALLGWYLVTYPPRVCTCDGSEPPWCPGERYGHVMPGWRDRLRTQLQELWDASLHDRARFSPHSAGGLMDRLLASRGAPPARSGPTLAPTHSLTAGADRESSPPRRPLAALSHGVSEGTRTPDTQDHIDRASLRAVPQGYIAPLGLIGLDGLQNAEGGIT